MKRKVIMPTIALVAILGAIALGTYPVSAHDATYSSLVTKIAERFNLKESDVQDVVNQVRSEHRASMTAQWETRLNKAVADGKITDAQKQLILAKHAEVMNKIEGFKDLSPQERKTKMKELADELKKWASDNSINTNELGFLRMHKLGKGEGMGWAKEK